MVPIVTNYFESMNEPTVGRTGLGDVTALVKYRFYRRDSRRVRLGMFVIVPLLSLLSVQFPEVSNFLFSWLQPALQYIK